MIKGTDHTGGWEVGLAKLRMVAVRPFQMGPRDIISMTDCPFALPRPPDDSDEDGDGGQIGEVNRYNV